MIKFLSKAAGVFGYVVQYGCLTHCTFEYLGDFVICSGPSMEPTLSSNNVLITERISPRLNMIQRGDIIIAKCPTNPAQHVCKRVVGLPGDKVLALPRFNYNPLANDNFSHSTVIVEDKPQPKTNLIQMDSDPHFHHNMKRIGKHIVVPRGHVWVEGDNYENSADSRYYGPIPQGLIRSRAILKLWPITDIKVLS